MAGAGTRRMTTRSPTAMMMAGSSTTAVAAERCGPQEAGLEGEEARPPPLCHGVRQQFRQLLPVRAALVPPQTGAGIHSDPRLR